MATHSSILAWSIHGQRSLAGYNPWGHEESDTTKCTHTTHTHTPVYIYIYIYISISIYIFKYLVPYPGVLFLKSHSSF